MSACDDEERERGRVDREGEGESGRGGRMGTWGRQWPRDFCDRWTAYLDERGHVDGVGGGAAGGEGGARAWEVFELVVAGALEEVDVDEKELVVESLHLAQKLGDERERLIKVLRLEQQRDEADFNAVPQEVALLRATPGGLLTAEVELELCGAGDSGDRVDDSAHDLCSFCLREAGEEWTEVCEKIAELGGLAGLGPQRGKPIDRLLLHFDRLHIQSVILRQET